MQEYQRKPLFMSCGAVSAAYRLSQRQDIANVSALLDHRNIFTKPDLYPYSYLGTGDRSPSVRVNSAYIFKK